jgi:triosephosphate isomerase
MHKTASEAAAFVRRLSELAPPTDGIEVVLAPSFTSLQAAAQAASPAFPFTLAAQNLHWEDKGAFTGEVSAPMLADLGCRYAILGHSERRQLFGEQDEDIGKKVLAALRHGLRPILCLGESLEEREAGRTESVVTGQLTRCLEGVSKDDVILVTIAYEPIWAIGTGRAATPVQATAVHETLRRTLASGWGSEAGEQGRILYGGSVTPENIEAFLASSQVDGALVGGACLDPQSFATICSLAQRQAGPRRR